jgi:D-alanine-D-alanine ligase
VIYLDDMNNSHNKRISKKRVGVLRGGPSSEYFASILTGGTILENLDRETYIPVDIFIDKSGNWHIDGVVKTPYAALQHVDIVFNGLHGEYGEDGTVQSILENFSLPYSGSDSFVSKISLDKDVTKKILSQKKILMPKGVKIRAHDTHWEHVLITTWQTFHHPLIIKPNSSGSSVGVSKVTDYPTLIKKTVDILSKGHDVLIEEHIEGREVSVSVVEHMRGKAHYTPVPLEVVYHGEFFSNASKKNSNYHLRPMVHFSQEERKLVQILAVNIHKILGLRSYSTADFIINNNGVYFIEINSLPGLSKNSIIPISLKESGVSMREFIAHILLSLEKIKKTTTFR